jgi:hypothetical protein
MVIIIQCPSRKRRTPDAYVDSIRSNRTLPLVSYYAKFPFTLVHGVIKRLMPSVGPVPSLGFIDEVVSAVFGRGTYFQCLKCAKSRGPEASDMRCLVRAWAEIVPGKFCPEQRRQLAHVEAIVARCG